MVTQVTTNIETTNQSGKIGERRTSVDDIFDELHEQITRLDLRPGDKISEAEVAAKFGVSRQPVRDAFNRLANLDLLLIRPQRATVVRGFSLREVEKSRFVRAAVEAEVLRRAARNCDQAAAKELDACLARQEDAIDSGSYQAFGALDYEFHRKICEIAGADYAFEVISAEKAKVDRLCILSLSKEDRMPLLLEDHQNIAEMIKSGEPEKAVEFGMLHLSRLDSTISTIAETNAEYFEAS